MKKYSLFLLCLMAAISLHAQRFADYFADKTLRVDYIFTGNARCSQWQRNLQNILFFALPGVAGNG